MPPKEVYLGISCGLHDSAVALVRRDGLILYACSEERFSRVKGDSCWPKHSLKKAIQIASIQNLKISAVCCHENHQKSFLRSFTRLLNPFQSPVFNRDQLNAINAKYFRTISQIDALLNKLSLTRNNLFFSDHHISHALASYAYSEAKGGIFFIFDAYGQGASGFVGYMIDEKASIKIIKTFKLKQSLGLFYSAITRICGFKVLTGEYKMMGLAPYGKPSYYKRICDTFGNPNINEFCTKILDPFADDLASKDLENYLHLGSRMSESSITSEYFDMAASAQKYLEKLALSILKEHIKKVPPNTPKNIFLGGGVALNCKLTQLIQEEFKDYQISICPSAGDAGSSIGACYAKVLENDRPKIKNSSVLIGNEVSAIEVDNFLQVLGFKTYSENDKIVQQIVSLLMDGKIGAVFDGKAEFGPRALGNRSIIADPSKPKALQKINTYIKAREDFRPLAPITTSYLAKKYFEVLPEKNQLLRYMLTLVNVPDKTQKLIGSAVHIDKTARLQVLDKSDERIISKIIRHFYDTSGVPALINTSFNQRGEPIVDSIQDALTCFSSSNLDFLLIQGFLVLRDEQTKQCLDSFRRMTPLSLD